MINFSKLFTLSVFAAMTTAAIAQLGQDYCTQSPDTGCYANGQPECCSDASSDCPEEKPPCDVTPSPTPSPTSVPVPLPGSDYCTFSPAPDCYENNGKPECCLNDSIDCPDEQPPCDVTPSPTPSPTSAPVPLPGSDYCTFSPDPTCYENNGKPECCLNDSIDCPDEQPPCNVTPSPTPLPSPGLTKPPTPLPTNSPSRRQTLEPTNSPTNRPTGRPTKNGDTPFPTFKSTPQPTEKPTNMPTNNPTKKGETSPPTDTPDFASCAVNEACNNSGLEGQCCPTEFGDFLDCCVGTSDSYSLKASSVSLCASAIATLFVVFLL